MAEYSERQKKQLAKKLKSINIISEKDILNVKVAELKQINENDKIPNLTIKDIEILWAMQEAIDTKTLMGFFVNTE